MKKSVAQEQPMGCAVACTAYILDRTYQQSLKLYENPQNAWGESGFQPKLPGKPLYVVFSIEQNNQTAS